MALTAPTATSLAAALALLLVVFEQVFGTDRLVSTFMLLIEDRLLLYIDFEGWLVAIDQSHIVPDLALEADIGHQSQAGFGIDPANVNRAIVRGREFLWNEIKESEAGR